MAANKLSYTHILACPAQDKPDPSITNQIYYIDGNILRALNHYLESIETNMSNNSETALYQRTIFYINIMAVVAQVFDSLIIMYIYIRMRSHAPNYRSDIPHPQHIRSTDEGSRYTQAVYYLTCFPYLEFKQKRKEYDVLLKIYLNMIQCVPN